MDASLPVPPAESRQRWRVTYACSEAAPGFGTREHAAAWESGILDSGLPVTGRDLTPARAKIVFAAPLGIGVRAERELADLFMTDRLPVAEVRAALRGHLPAGHDLVDLHDVWLGESALSSQVVAADYRGRVVVDGSSLDEPATPSSTAAVAATIATAARGLLEASSLPRTRNKGGRAVPYDLRPLVAAVDVQPRSEAAPRDPGSDIWIRVRFDPERGVGKPAEVLAALAEASGLRLAFVSLVRVRVVLAGTSLPQEPSPLSFDARGASPYTPSSRLDLVGVPVHVSRTAALRSAA